MYNPTELCELAEKYGADKCPKINHSYTPFYYELFKDIRNDVKKVFEFGVGNNRQFKHIPNYTLGASLYVWRDFFPNAQIYGADIEPESIFDDGRVKTFLCDERDKNQIEELIKKVGSDIDIFIDDASHHIHDQRFLCETVMPLLNKGVIYIIEDTGRARMLSEQLSQYDCFEPKLLVPSSLTKKHSNSLLVVKHKI
jgi:hypothetical protein